MERQGRGGQDAHQLSADVRGLLAAANVPSPYVVAGHSVGGAYALAYAMDYPADVAGVALIDSATPYQFDLSVVFRPSTQWRIACRAVAAAGARGHRPGVHRACRVRVRCPRMPEASAGFRLVTARTECRSRSSSRSCQRSSPDKALTSLDGKPLFVLTAEAGQKSGWFAAQDRLATLSTNSAHQTAHGATHQALLDDKHYAALSARAIEAVVRPVRTGSPLSP